MIFLEKIQTKEVVPMAAIVPIGIDFWASFRFPERFDPAIIPGEMKHSWKQHAFYAPNIVTMRSKL